MHGAHTIYHNPLALRAGPYRRLPGWRDLAALVLVVGVVILIAGGVRQMVEPVAHAQAAPISLSPEALPFYTLRTVLRMLAALAASLLFTLTYATLAAKSRRAERVLIPLLDVLQSVPVLGYVSFTVAFFVSLFPGNTLGAELAAIFATDTLVESRRRDVFFRKPDTQKIIALHILRRLAAGTNRADETLAEDGNKGR